MDQLVSRPCLTSLRRAVAAWVCVLLTSYGGAVSAQTPSIPPNATEAELKKITIDAAERKKAIDALIAVINAEKALAAAKDTSKTPSADEIAAAKAAKELADAQKAQVEAEKALAAVKDTTKAPSADEIGAAKAAKELAELQKAKAEAEKAIAEASNATTKAKFGDVPISGFTGAVELGANSGSTEALLLASAAVRIAAKEMAVAIGNSKPVTMTKVMLYTSSTVPDFQALASFRAQREGFKASFDATNEATKDAPKGGGLAASVTTVGLALDAAGKLLNFFKTDFKFQNFEIATSDSMLLAAVAGELQALTQPVRAQAPTLYQAGIAGELQQTVVDDIKDALGRAQQALLRMAPHLAAEKEREPRVAALLKIKADEAKPKAERDSAAAEAAKLQDEIQRAREAAALWKALADRIDTWSTKLATPDDKGQIPLAAVVRQAAVQAELEGGAALVVLQLHKAAGTGYTKKNLLSSIFANPFFVMGGAVASMTAINGVTGDVFASALVPVHGGYHSVSDVQAVVNRR